MNVEATIEGVTDLRNPLPDISGPISHAERIQQILEVLGSKLGPEPYGSLASEMVSPIGETDRLALVGLMLSLPHPMGHILFRTSANLNQISQDAATHNALETMYVGPNRNGITEVGNNFLWARLMIENVHNSMAVRNRLRQVKQEFRCFIDDFAGDADSINVLSVAAGSSRGLLEEVAAQPPQIRSNIRLKLIDVAPEAGEDAGRLARQLGIGDLVETVTANVLKVNSYLKEGYKAHFIEVVGLLDYLEDRHAVNLLGRLSSCLIKGGMILCSNIRPNDEERFTHQIVGWPEMKYRPAETLVAFVQQAGFSADAIRLIPEPLGIYNIVSARR